MKIIHKIPDEHWQEKIWIIFSTPKKFAQYIMKKHNTFVHYPKHAGCMIDTIDNNYYIWIHEDCYTDCSSSEIIGLISHEVFHVVHKILDKRGFNLCDDSQEAYAYYVGFLMTDILYILEAQAEAEEKAADKKAHNKKNKNKKKKKKRGGGEKKKKK